MRHTRQRASENTFLRSFSAQRTHTDFKSRVKYTPDRFDQIDDNIESLHLNNEQHGAAEARRAHNPEGGRSKLPVANFFGFNFFISVGRII